MKIFLDTGDAESVRRAQDTGLLDGVTTNPSLIAKTGRGFKEVVSDICKITSGPVSVEVMADEAAGMVAEARQISSLSDNIAIKVPMTAEGLKAVPILEKEHNIHCNVTMIFSATQTFLAMKAGATFVSIVLSRLDAVANESEFLINDAVMIKDNFAFKSEIIAGSVKTQNHVLNCLRAGVDIVTVPMSLFFQMFQHPLTDAGIRAFREDWAKVPD